MPSLALSTERHGQHGAKVGTAVGRWPPRTMAPPVLLVVLHGEAFRLDGRLFRVASEGLSAQLEMLNALQRNVLTPASQLGWVVQCVAHLAYTARPGSTRSVRSLLAALKGMHVYPVEIQPVPAAAGCKAVPLASIMRALQWLTSRSATGDQACAMLDSAVHFVKTP